VLKSLSGEKRLTSYYLLAEGVHPKDIADRFDNTRQGVQRYIQSWKENDLIRSEGNDYVFTEKGERVLEIVQQMLDEF